MTGRGANQEACPWCGDGLLLPSANQPNTLSCDRCSFSTVTALGILTAEDRQDVERDLNELRRRQAEVLATPPVTGIAGRRRIAWLKRTYAEEQRLLALLEDE